MGLNLALEALMHEAHRILFLVAVPTAELFHQSGNSAGCSTGELLKHPRPMDSLLYNGPITAVCLNGGRG